MRVNGIEFSENLELTKKVSVVDILRNGGIMPNKIMPDPIMELQLRKYREKVDGLGTHDKSRVYQSKAFTDLRTWINYIDEVNRQNASGYHLLVATEQRASVENKPLLQKAIKRWLEYIRENERYCRGLNIQANSGNFNMLK